MDYSRLTILLSTVSLIALGAVGVVGIGAAANPTGPDTPTTGATTETTGEETVTVTRAVDGDTLEVELADGSTDTIRLLGIDAPETSTQDTSPSEYEGVPEGATNCLADEGGDAADYMANTLEGETVTLKYDEESDMKGDFNRTLAYVYYEGVDYNYKLVKTGRARVYDSTFTKRSDYYAAESDAQASNRDLWRCKNAGGIGDFDIESISPADDPQQESVAIEYASTALSGTSADLEGYTVTEEDGTSYTFGSNTILVATETATLYTGSGTDLRTLNGWETYWGLEEPVWEPTCETVTLTSPDGELVTTRYTSWEPGCE